MKSSRPPSLATWILDHFVPNNESLAGDLIEQFRQGRSSLWYWRQVAVAIVVTTIHEIRAHPLLTLRGIAVGWAFVWLYFGFVAYRLTDVDDLLFGMGFVGTYTRWPWLHHRLTLWMIGWIGCAATGWVVARFNGRSMPVVFAYLVVSILWWDVPRFGRLALDAIDQDGGLFALFEGAAFVFFSFRLPILIGGYWGVLRKGDLNILG